MAEDASAYSLVLTCDNLTKRGYTLVRWCSSAVCVAVSDYCTLAYDLLSFVFKFWGFNGSYRLIFFLVGRIGLANIHHIFWNLLYLCFLVNNVFMFDVDIVEGTKLVYFQVLRMPKVLLVN